MDFTLITFAFIGWAFTCRYAYVIESMKSKLSKAGADYTDLQMRHAKRGTQIYYIEQEVNSLREQNKLLLSEKKRECQLAEQLSALRSKIGELAQYAEQDYLSEDDVDTEDYMPFDPEIQKQMDRIIKGDDE